MDTRQATSGSLPDPAAVRAAIDDFLAHPRIALVGVSTRAEHFSRMVFHRLRDNGFDVVPVNAKATDIEGAPCYDSVEHIDPPVDGALIMTPQSATLGVVEQCERAGVRRVWMHRGGGVGSVSPEAVEFCREQNISVVPGQCPFMFVGQPEGPHRVHGEMKRLWGTYPTADTRPMNLALALYALLGWVLCSVAMQASMAWLPTLATLFVHALAAPLIFAAFSTRYHRIRPYADPLVSASLFTAQVVALDLLVVVLFAKESLALLTTPLGAWVPFVGIFVSVWAAGHRVRRNRARK